jgi:hypothetical protein
MAKLDFDLSKIKSAFKGLGFLRAYSSLLLPFVIILAGVIVLTGALLLGRSFRNTVTRLSIPMGTQIKGMEGKEDNLLAAKQIEAEKAYQDQYEKDANSIEKMDIQSSMRELLSYNILPRPEDTSALIFTGFGNSYRKGIEGLIEKVNGRDCPSDEEFSVAGLNKQSVRGMRFSGDTEGREQDKIAEGICLARAKSVSVYSNPNDVSGYIFWEKYQYKDLNSAVDDCWYWQQGYWIAQDIFETAAEMNKGSTAVFGSPVKRIMRIGFASSDKMLTTTGNTMTVSQDKPKYVIKPEEQLTEACTGRISNNDYNVIHFGFVAVVKANEILPFMKALCSAKEHRFKGYKGDEGARVFKHNQITILETNIKAVDPASPEHRYYRYGYDSVEEVEFICEYIFNKKGYEPINPAVARSNAGQGQATN